MENTENTEAQPNQEPAAQTGGEWTLHYLFAGVAAAALLLGIVVPMFVPGPEYRVERFLMAGMLPFLVFILWKQKK